MNLHGYGPTLQGVLGATAWCEFNASAGGEWPSLSWPSLNRTSNVFFGKVDEEGRPTTVMLNYGPAWQYNPTAENAIPGGSVSFIANNTGQGVSFPQLCAAYIRNQWTLMAYSIPRQCGLQRPLAFTGPSPIRLYISLTTASILPGLALLLELFVTIWA